MTISKAAIYLKRNLSYFRVIFCDPKCKQEAEGKIFILFITPYHNIKHARLEVLRCFKIATLI